MRRFLIFITLLLASISASAQLKSISVNSHADTLLVNTASVEDIWVDLFKGADGYLFKLYTINYYNNVFKGINNKSYDNVTFYNKPSFFIGETPADALITLNELADLCNNNVATRAEVVDFKGNSFHIHTASSNNLERSTLYEESDRLLIWNDDMETPLILLKKTIEETQKYLEKHK